MILGNSLGGALVIQILEKIKLKDFKGIIIQNTFTSLEDVFKNRYKVISFLKFLINEKWNNLSILQHSKYENIPALFLRSKKDEIIPSSMMIKLYTAFKSSNKSFVTLSGGHQTIFENKQYYAEIASFVSKVTMTKLKYYVNKDYYSSKMKIK